MQATHPQRSHWWMTALPLLSLLGLVSGGCFELQCERDEDCLSGEKCNPETNRCYVPDPDAGDAGADAGDAAQGDAGDAGDAEPECTQSSQCTAPAEPICDATDLECRGCQADPECLARDPSTPACDAPACVECTDSALHCSGTAPICEPTTNACRACASHADCDLAGGVCDWTTGACLAESEVIYANDDTCPGTGDGSRTTPYCSLQDAVDAVTAGRTTILVAPGTYSPIDVVGAGTVWIVGESGAEVGTGVNESIVYLSGTTDLTLEGLHIYDSFGTGAGVECDGNITTQPTLTIRESTLISNAGGGVTALYCTVTLDANEVTGNAGGGVTASYCTVTLDANEVTGNAGGGVSLSFSDFTLTNNIIAQNGSGSSSYGGVMIFMPGDPADFWHNTVVDNVVGNATSAGIRCVDTVSIVSTISHDNSNADLSSFCSASYSWTTADGTPLFVGSGDYHLQPGSPCIDEGDPATTLDHDIDGDLRPQGGGPDIGADEAQ